MNNSDSPVHPGIEEFEHFYQREFKVEPPSPTSCRAREHWLRT